MKREGVEHSESATSLQQALEQTESQLLAWRCGRGPCEKINLS